MSWTVQIDIRPNPETDETVHYFPVEEVAQMLRKTRRTIDRYIDRGIFTQRTIYGVSCIAAVEVMQYIAGQRQEAS